MIIRPRGITTTTIFLRNRADEEEDTGSLDEGDTFEGETYLRAGESLQEKTKRYEEENGESTHVLPSLLFPVAEPSFLDKEKYYTCTSRGL